MVSEAFFVASAMGSGAGVVAGAISSLMKRVFERARPDAWLGHDVLRWEGETSFPSGHTIGAFALMVVILVGARSRALRIVAVLLAVSVAVARVLALRHWPSDVLAGWALGAAWACLGWLVFRRMEPRNNRV